MTSRELVRRTMEFRNTDARAPRDLWVLPWASIHHGAALADIRRRYPNDYGGVPVVLKETSPVEKGDPCAIGEYTDPWGCTFLNIQQGVIGEVKQPLVTDDDWLDTSRVVIPEYQLSFDIEQVNAACAETDRWITAGCCPRPFEQLQFIRGSENLYMDLADPSPGFFAFLERMHDFYCRLMTKWAQTDVDCLTFMDDWGSQKSLLISPEMWRQYFRPLYQDYIDIAHRHGKKISMHSDGNTLSIIPDLIEMGLDALNTQIFCIGVDKLAPFKGKITFWGKSAASTCCPTALWRTSAARLPRFLIPCGTTVAALPNVNSGQPRSRRMWKPFLKPGTGLPADGKHQMIGAFPAQRSEQQRTLSS